MSRIGRKPVVIPAGVEVTLDGNTVTVKVLVRVPFGPFTVTV